MLPVSAGVCLSALFIDFDNIYLSLKGRDEEAAARFSRNPTFWLGQLVSGSLLRADHLPPGTRRRIAVGRCYGNPVPRRTGRDGAGDPTSFAYVRHNFMRAGLEVVDCPHLTSQFKNSSDIRIACDVRDYRDHPTRFDEFIILSGDADFTPVLLSLRSHARATVIYANEYTSPYYKAFADARVEEDDLIRTLMQSEPVPALSDESNYLPALEQATRQGTPALSLRQPQAAPIAAPMAATPGPATIATAAALSDAGRKRRTPGSADAAIQSLIDDFKAIGSEILELVLDVVDNSEKPVPLAYLADRAQKTLGHAKTIGTNWAGSGGFLNFLTQNLPEQLQLSEKPPHFVYNPSKHRLREEVRPVELPPMAAPVAAPVPPAPAAAAQPAPTPAASAAAPALPRPKDQGNTGRLAELQRSITRIYEACQAPPLPPSEYQVLFALIAAEVRENGFAPERTAASVVTRATEAGLKLSAKDVSFVIEAVDEVDPWLEHTRSPSAVARAYRDYVFARCSQAGVQLSDDEYQLVQVWFGASQWNGATAQPAGDQPAAAQAPAAPAEPARRMATPEPGGLPAPAPHAGMPPLPEFNIPAEQEPVQQPAKTSPLRYSFLKHG